MSRVSTDRPNLKRLPVKPWASAALASAATLPPQTSTAAPAVSAPYELDRTILPIAAPEPPRYTELDVRNATPPPRFQVKAPEDAPNVLVVLVDDLGFAGTSTFGGPVTTPTFKSTIASSSGSMEPW